MKRARTIAEIRAAVAEARRRGAQKVGLVATMGALHDGHYSLIDAARRDCDFTVVSIFVNPTQFGPDEDYRRYPRALEADVAGCQSRGVDAVFTPEVCELYPEGFATTVHVAGLTERLCGAFRPGHFDGVCTVVAKLFNTVGPDVAYFGEKDYQQAIVVRRMVADLDMQVRVEVCPTVREKLGLAMSTRNACLSAEERAQAGALYESLELARRLIQEGGRSPAEITQAVRAHLAAKAPLGTIDYVEIVDPDSLSNVELAERPVVVAVAVRFPAARLIDNMRVDLPEGGD
jgi:pantoate--beta-alanine ligase